MIGLLRSFFDICRLRLSPADLPTSPFLLRLSLVMYLAVAGGTALLSLPLIGAVSLAALDAALVAGLLWALLWVRDLLNRLPQTLTALYGAGTVLQAFAIPLVLWQAAAGGGAVVGLPEVLLWGWMIWHLLVVGHVLRHAVDTTLPLGTLLALLYVFVSFSITRTILFTGG